DVEVKTLVVPEGGELPPDEELAAMEAAERGEEATPEAEPQSEGLEELGAELAAEDEIGAAAEPEGPGEIEATGAEPDSVPADAFDRADADYERPPDDFQAAPDSRS